MDEQIAAKRLLCKDSVLPASAPSLKNVAKRLRHFAECVEAEPAAQVAILFPQSAPLWDLLNQTAAQNIRERRACIMPFTKDSAAACKSHCRWQRNKMNPKTLIRNRQKAVVAA